MRSRGPFPPIHKIAIFPGSSLLQQRSEGEATAAAAAAAPDSAPLVRLLSEPRVCFVSIFNLILHHPSARTAGFFFLSPPLTDLGLTRLLRYDLDWIVENGIVVVVAIIKDLKPDPKHVHSEVRSTEFSVPGHLKAA